MAAKGDAFRVIIIGGAAIVLAALMGVISLFALHVYLRHQYYSHTGRMRAAIDNMSLRRPANVDAEIWEEACNWLHTATANVCFSPEHVPFKKVRELCLKFEARVQGPVDLNTVDWMTDEFAAASPHGADYVEWHRGTYLASIEHQQPELLNDKMRKDLRRSLELWNSPDN